ncbi:MAG TPA: type II secretion system F family protein [Candidatus Acidoferrum sp.]|nr:type II secretion system F family protein [Candidatus Acidoferrum sp.]
MIWLLTLLTFVATMGVVVALFFAFSPGEVSIASRLARIAGLAGPAPEETKFADRQKERVRDTLANVGKLLPAPSTEKATRTQLLMIRAGYRSAEALMAMRGVKVIFPIAALAAVYFTGAYRYNAFMVPVVAFALGFLLPDMWLTWRVSSRQHKLRKALPDALDLLVICVEAGLGLDQALMKVSQDMRISHPELSEELQLVNMEMRIGKTRIDALRELARRTGLDDIKALVAMLIQTERFGTSIAQSLRVYSDDMRLKRRQRAEEMSAKTSVKMVPPLVFFIFPALMVIILGPAILTLMRQLMPALSR